MSGYYKENGWPCLEKYSIKLCLALDYVCDTIRSVVLENNEFPFYFKTTAMFDIGVL